MPEGIWRCLRKRAGRASPPAFLIIFTDLDGTLLDHDTYDWQEARPALQLCRRRGVPVVLVSSKTSAEMEGLRQEMDLPDPFISENGGGIFFPAGTGAEPPAAAVSSGALWKLSLGVPYPHLVAALREIRTELGWSIRGFSDMPAAEIARLTGLDPAAAALAARREFDEPFLVERPEIPDENALARAAAKRGLRVTAGGRFLHLKGLHHKGKAMGTVLAWYRRKHTRPVAAALGDSPNDFPMLERADFPFLIQSRRSYPELQRRLPRLTVTRQSGPRGWNSAVLDLLSRLQEEGHE